MPMKRTPINRGKGFKRPSRAGVRAHVERETKWPSALTTPARAAIQMIAQLVAAQPKENVCHSSTYEARVRKLACRRCGVVNLSQFCHADMDKGTGIKTDVRRGWAGCGPRDGIPGCHWYVGTSGNMKKEDRRAFEEWAAASTRAEILSLGQWPKRLPLWQETEPKVALAQLPRAQVAINLGASV